MNQRVILYLQDTADGPPIQYWTFEDDLLIRIVRSLWNHVVISNNYTPVMNSYVLIDEKGWCANAISEQGLLLGPNRCDHIPCGPVRCYASGVPGRS
jgi:hypothetical protein